jgi:hypothetical protein
MSGSPLDLIPGLPTGTWRDGLRPASFRGVPFEVEGHRYQGGRRVAEHEFPLSDRGTTEDLGRSLRRINIEAFVLGQDYMARRDALLAACEEGDKPGTLIHPTLGEFQVRCLQVTLEESKNNGGVAVFALSFIEQPQEAVGGLLVGVDTLSGTLAAVGRVLRAARVAFSIYQVARRDLGGFLMRAGLGLLTSGAEYLAGRFLGLPGLDLLGTARALGGTASPGAPRDAADYAVRITAPIEAVAVALPAPRPASELGEAFGSRGGSGRDVRIDAGHALLALAVEPAIVPVQGNEPSGGVAVRLATDELLRRAALAGAVQAFSLASWPYADEAVRVRDVLLVRLDAAADQAADAGHDELHRAWRALTVAVVQDFRERIQQAPRLVPYTVGRSLPALALAHRIYQDAARADELAAITDAPHPAFLPAAGLRISP